MKKSSVKKIMENNSLQLGMGNGYNKTFLIVGKYGDEEFNKRYEAVMENEPCSAVKGKIVYKSEKANKKYIENFIEILEVVEDFIQIKIQLPEFSNKEEIKFSFNGIVKTGKVHVKVVDNSNDTSIEDVLKNTKFDIIGELTFTGKIQELVQNEKAFDYEDLFDSIIAIFN